MRIILHVVFYIAIYVARIAACDNATTMPGNSVRYILQEKGRIARGRISEIPKINDGTTQKTIECSKQSLLIRDRIDNFLGNRKRTSNGKRTRVRRSSRKKTSRARESAGNIKHHRRDFESDEIADGNDILPDAAESQRLPVWQVPESTTIVYLLTYPDKFANITDKRLEFFKSPNSDRGDDSTLRKSKNRVLVPARRLRTFDSRLPNSFNEYSKNSPTSDSLNLHGDDKKSRGGRLANFYRRFLLVPVSKDLYALKDVNDKSRQANRGDGISAILAFKAHMHHNAKDVGRTYLQGRGHGAYDSPSDLNPDVFDDEGAASAANADPNYSQPNLASQTYSSLSNTAFELSEISDEQTTVGVSPYASIYSSTEDGDVNLQDEINSREYSSSTPFSFDSFDLETSLYSEENDHQLSSVSPAAELDGAIEPFRLDSGNYKETWKLSKLGVVSTTLPALLDAFNTDTDTIVTPEDVELHATDSGSEVSYRSRSTEDYTFLPSTPYLLVGDAEDILNGNVNSMDERSGDGYSSERTFETSDDDERSSKFKDLDRSGALADDALLNITAEEDSSLRDENRTTPMSLTLHTDERSPKREHIDAGNFRNLLTAIGPVYLELQKLLTAVKLVNESIGDVQGRLCDKMNIARSARSGRNGEKGNIMNFAVDRCHPSSSSEDFISARRKKKRVKKGEGVMRGKTVESRKRTDGYFFVNNPTGPSRKSGFFPAKRRKPSRGRSSESEKRGSIRLRLNRNLKSLMKNYETQRAPLVRSKFEKMSHSTNPAISLSRLIKSYAFGKNSLSSGRDVQRCDNRSTSTNAALSNTFAGRSYPACFLSDNKKDAERNDAKRAVSGETRTTVDPLFHKGVTAYVDLLKLLSGTIEPTEYPIVGLTTRSREMTPLISEPTELFETATTAVIEEELPTVTEFVSPESKTDITEIEYYEDSEYYNGWNNTEMYEEGEGEDRENITSWYEYTDEMTGGILNITKAAIPTIVTSGILETTPTMRLPVVLTTTILPFIQTTRELISTIEQVAVSTVKSTSETVAILTEGVSVEVTETPIVKKFTNESAIVLTPLLKGMTDITLKITIPAITVAATEATHTLITETTIIEERTTYITIAILETTERTTSTSMETVTTSGYLIAEEEPAVQIEKPTSAEEMTTTETPTTTEIPITTVRPQIIQIPTTKITSAKYLTTETATTVEPPTVVKHITTSETPTITEIFTRTETIKSTNITVPTKITTTATRTTVRAPTTTQTEITTEIPRITEITTRKPTTVGVTTVTEILMTTVTPSFTRSTSTEIATVTTTPTIAETATPTKIPTTVEISETTKFPTLTEIVTTTGEPTVTKTSTSVKTTEITSTEIATATTTLTAETATPTKIPTTVEISETTKFPTSTEIATTTGEPTATETSTSVKTTEITSTEIATAITTLTIAETATPTKIPTTVEISETTKFPTSTEIATTTGEPTAIETSTSVKTTEITISKISATTETLMTTTMSTLAEISASTETTMTESSIITTPAMIETSEVTEISTSTEITTTEILTRFVPPVTTGTLTTETSVITEISTSAETAKTETTISEISTSTETVMFYTSTTTEVPVTLTTETSLIIETSTSAKIVTTESIITEISTSAETLRADTSTTTQVPITTVILTKETTITETSTSAETATTEIPMTTATPVTTETLSTESSPITEILTYAETTMTESTITETSTSATTAVEETSIITEISAITETLITTVISTATEILTSNKSEITTERISLVSETSTSLFTRSTITSTTPAIFTYNATEESSTTELINATFVTITEETPSTEEIVTFATTSEATSTSAEVTLAPTEAGVTSSETETIATSFAPTIVNVTETIMTSSLLLEITTETTTTSLTTSPATLESITERLEPEEIIEEVSNTTLTSLAETSGYATSTETPTTLPEVTSLPPKTTLEAEEFATTTKLTTESPSTYTTKSSIASLTETTTSASVTPVKKVSGEEIEYYVGTEPEVPEEEEYEEEEYEVEIPTDRWYDYEEYEAVTEKEAKVTSSSVKYTKTPGRTTTSLAESATTRLYETETSELTTLSVTSETATVRTDTATPSTTATSRTASTYSPSTQVEEVTWTPVMETSKMFTASEETESATTEFTFGSTEEYTLPLTTVFRLSTEPLESLTISPKYTRTKLTSPRLVTESEKIPDRKTKVTSIKSPDFSTETEVPAEKLTSFFVSSTLTTLSEEELVEEYAASMASTSSSAALDLGTTEYEVTSWSPRMTPGLTEKSTILEIETSSEEETISSVSKVETEMETKFTSPSKISEEIPREGQREQLLRQLDELDRLEKKLMEKEERLKEKEQQWEREKEKYRKKMMERKKEEEERKETSAVTEITSSITSTTLAAMTSTETSFYSVEESTFATDTTKETEETYTAAEKATTTSYEMSFTTPATMASTVAFTEEYSSSMLASTTMTISVTGTTSTFGTTTYGEYDEEIEDLQEELRKRQHDLEKKEKQLLEREERLEKDMAEFERYMKKVEEGAPYTLTVGSTAPINFLTPLPPTEMTTVRVTPLLMEITTRKESVVTAETRTPSYGITEKLAIEEKEKEEERESESVPVESVTKRICLNVLANATIPLDRRRKGIASRKVCLPYFPEKSTEKKSVGRLNRSILALRTAHETDRAKLNFPPNFRRRRRKRKSKVKETTRKISNLQLSHHEWLNNKVTKSLRHLKGFTRIYAKTKGTPLKNETDARKNITDSVTTSSYEQRVDDPRTSHFRTSTSMSSSKKDTRREIFYKNNLSFKKRGGSLNYEKMRRRREEKDIPPTEETTAGIPNRKVTTVTTTTVKEKGTSEDEGEDKVTYTVNVLRLGYNKDEETYKLLPVEPDDYSTALSSESTDEGVYKDEYNDEGNDFDQDTVSGEIEEIAGENYEPEEHNMKEEDNGTFERTEKTESGGDYDEEVTEGGRTISEQTDSSDPKAWPTEKSPKYHLGGTRYWELDYEITEPSDTTLSTAKSTAKTIDLSGIRTTCLHMVLKNERDDMGKRDARSERNARFTSAFGKHGLLKNATSRNFLRNKSNMKQPSSTAERMFKEFESESQRSRESNRCERNAKSIPQTGDEISIVTKGRRLCGIDENKQQHKIFKHKNTKDCGDNVKKTRTTEPPKSRNAPSHPSRIHDSCEINKKNSNQHHKRMNSKATVNHRTRVKHDKSSTNKVKTEHHDAIADRKSQSISSASRERKIHECSNCICNIARAIDDIKSILSRTNYPLDEIKALNCSEFKETPDKITISLDFNAEDVKAAFPQPRYNTESLKGQKYVRLEEMENDFRTDSILENDRDVICLPGFNLNVPCNRENVGASWLSSLGRPSYVWKRTDGIALFGFVAENGDLELRNVNAKDTGNYTCIMTHVSADNEEPVETAREIRLRVVTLPRYVLHGEMLYHVRFCDERDLDVLATYFPLKLNNAICETGVCNAYVLAPSCSRSQIIINVLVVPAPVAKLMTVDHKHCDVFCLKAIQDKFSLMLSRNLQIFLGKTIIFRSPHFEQRLVPIVERSMSFARQKRGRTGIRALAEASNNVGLFSSCPAGYGLRGTHCAACNVDTYSEDGASHCKKCQPGTYQPNHGARVCRTCTNPLTKGCSNMLWNSFSAVMVTLASLSVAFTVFLLLLWLICCAKKKLCVKRIASIAHERDSSGQEEHVEKQPLIRDLSDNEDQQSSSEYRVKRKNGRFYVNKKRRRRNGRRKHEKSEARKNIHEDEWGSHRTKDPPVICLDSYRSHGDIKHYPKQSYRKGPRLPECDFDTS